MACSADPPGSPRMDPGRTSSIQVCPPIRSQLCPERAAAIRADIYYHLLRTMHTNTGVLNFSQWGFYYQVQAMAVPENVSDPLLEVWTKPDLGNPLSMTIPPGGESGIDLYCIASAGGIKIDNFSTYVGLHPKGMEAPPLPCLWSICLYLKYANLAIEGCIVRAS